MLKQIKKVIKKLLPTSIRGVVKKVFYFPKVESARLAFIFSGKEPSWLSPDLIDAWIKTFPPVGDYDYSDEGRAKRGVDRAKMILDLMGGKAPNSTLELGCMDAMASAALLKEGVVSAIGLDVDDAISPAAKQAGVKFLHIPAENIPLPDSSVDLVFSFNTLEHVVDPAQVVQEIKRVLRPGGYFFADFDPLYYSARGLHAYRKINIPYCQFLFKNEDLVSYADKHQLNWAELPGVNKYSADQFRQVWSKMNEDFEIKHYSEEVDLVNIDLVRKYPSCFKKERMPFHNFLISRMRILAKKKI